MSLLALFAWSLAIGEFVTSPLGREIALAAGIGMAVLMGVWTYFDPVYAHDTLERAARLAKAPAMANPVARVLFLGVFMGLITFQAVSGAVLEFWTLAVGQPGEQTMHLGDYQSSSRANCAGFDLQEAPLKLHRVVCADYRYGEAPDPGALVRVRGPVSAVGIKIEQFQISADE